jgi:hypothetical protein
LPASPGAPTGGAQKIVVVEQPTPVVAGRGNGPVGIATTGQPDIPPDLAPAIEAALRGAIPLFGIMLSMVAIIFVGWPIARAIARRLDKRAEIGMIKAADVQAEIRNLQESVDAMAVELERISEAQRYQARLLSGKAPMVPAREGPPA